MFDKNLAIVDVETTGINGLYDRVIELGIIRVENGKIVDKLNTLINPETDISPFIEQFTGIKNEELKSAPIFSEVKNKVEEILTDAVFVAHNAHFDYSFIKHELKRSGTSFSAKTLCTVKLSRRLFPEHRSHNLESLINRFDFLYKRRHRAYDDAHVVWQFLKKINKQIAPDELEEIIKILLKTNYRTSKEIAKQIEKLPETTGVYIFYDKNKVPLYVGKSKSIKDRVITHFSTNYQLPRQLEMIKRIRRIDYISTAGKLGALIEELNLIKTLSPLFNQKLRQKKRLLLLSKYKKDKWPFRGPIVINEKNEEEELYESFIVDKWCLLGCVKNNDQHEINGEYDFDLDTYKILSQYIKYHKPNYRIINNKRFK